MHPSLDRRNQRIYLWFWIVFVLAIGVYIVASRALHLPRVAAIVFAMIPGISLIVLPHKIRPSGFHLTGRFRLESGETIIRTIPVYLPDKPDDEMYFSMAGTFLRQLQADGYQFPEGMGQLVEVLNKPGAIHKRLILQGDFRMGNGEVVTRTISCPLGTRINDKNFREVREDIEDGLRATGFPFPDGVGRLVETKGIMFA